MHIIIPKSKNIFAKMATGMRTVMKIVKFQTTMMTQESSCAIAWQSWPLNNVFEKRKIQINTAKTWCQRKEFPEFQMNLREPTNPNTEWFFPKLHAMLLYNNALPHTSLQHSFQHFLTTLPGTSLQHPSTTLFPTKLRHTRICFPRNDGPNHDLFGAMERSYCTGNSFERPQHRGYRRDLKPKRTNNQLNTNTTGESSVVQNEWWIQGGSDPWDIKASVYIHRSSFLVQEISE